MPLDPNIALQAKPPQIQDPMESYGRVMQLKNMAQQQQIGGMQMQQQQIQLQSAQQDQQEQAIIMQAYGEVGGDLDQLPRALAGRVSPEKLIKIQQAAADQKKKLTDAKESDLKLWQTQAKITGEAAAFLKSLPPEQREGVLPGIAAKLQEAGIPPDQIPQSVPDDATLDFYIASGLGTEKKAAMEIQQRTEAHNSAMRPLQKREQTAKTVTAERTQANEQGLTPSQVLQSEQNNPTSWKEYKLATKDGSFKGSYNQWLTTDANRKKPINSTVYEATPGKSVIDPNSNSILAQTGLSRPAYDFLTIGTSALTRMSGADRARFMKEGQEFTKKHGIDEATFRAQFSAINKTVEANVLRNNQSGVAQDELVATIDNLSTAADEASFRSLKWANVAKMFLGEQVNDPTVNRYKFHLEQLRNEFAMYNAALQGQIDANGNIREINESDLKRAESIIRDGFAAGSLKGFESALKSSMDKMNVVMNRSVEAQNKRVWKLFGLNKKSANPGEGQPSPKTGTPAVGTVKTFPNGKKGKWDGQGWEAIQ